MSKNNNTKQQQRSTFRNYQYLFIAAAVATAIAGIVHLYMPLSHPRMLGNLPVAVFFLGSGIAQIFWILPMIKRWGKKMVLHRNCRKYSFHSIICYNQISW